MRKRFSKRQSAVQLNKRSMIPNGSLKNIQRKFRKKEVEVSGIELKRKIQNKTVQMVTEKLMPNEIHDEIVELLKKRFNEKIKSQFYDLIITGTVTQ